MPLRARIAVASILLAVCAAGTAGCSKSPPRSKVWVPPRVDLARWGTLGMITFSGQGASDLAAAASREFIAALQSAQPGTPVLELGEEAQVLAALAADSLDADAVRAIGAKHQVQALVVGVLESDRTAPSFSFDSVSLSMAASAEIEGTFSARILDTRTGATIWTTSVRGKQTLGRVDLSATSGLTGGGGNRADEAKQRLVVDLIERGTADFWGYWAWE